MPPYYGEEVLGKRCSILWELSCGSRKANKEKFQSFDGLVTSYKAELIDDEDDDEEHGEEGEVQQQQQQIQREHYVAFDDGDVAWFNLDVEEKLGRLKWIHQQDDEEQVAVVVKKEERSKEEEPAAAAKEIVIMKEADDDKEEEEEEEEEGDIDDDDDNNSKPAAVTARAPASAAVVTPQRKRKQSTNGNSRATGTTTAAPKKKKRSKKPPPFTEEQMERLDKATWIDDMDLWLQNTPHGPKHKVVSVPNARSVMRQVRKLVSGQGVSYTKWPDDIVFYKDRPVHLSTTNFDEMLLEAKYHEGKYGEDSGHGWLLTHPIKKMHLFQEYREEREEATPAARAATAGTARTNNDSPTFSDENNCFDDDDDFEI